MNISLNINKFGGKSIVPITCGSSRGTAFYIGEGRFLTAWHVVSEAESLGEPICLLIEGNTIYCRLDKLGNMDAALLTSLNELPDISPIELLKAEFRDEDLEIIGYPQELGNGIDYFGVSVKNLKALNDNSRGFDVMVQRTDPFGFHSYSGFSGSPVLNQKGVAIGVVTDQLYNTLGYTSISSISGYLSQKRVKFLENADLYDMRPFGIGKCIELAEKSCLKMKSRFNEENHVKDDALEERLQIFCGYQIDRWDKQARNKLNDWYQKIGFTIKTAIDQKLNNLKAYMEGSYVNSYDLSIDMEFLLTKRTKDKSNNYFVTGFFRDQLLEISSLMDKAQESEILAKEQFLYVHGDAGSGKTQHMCYFTKSISLHQNVYLLFGTDFEASKNPVQSIREALGWEKENILQELNNEMEQKNRYATFIIDALNEGEGTFMWSTLLPILKEEIRNYSRLKLIVTVRTMEPGDQLKAQFKRDWEEIEIEGFSNLPEALEKYFKDANIYEKVEDYLYVKEFQHPLFLKIFCQVYQRLSADNRKDLDILLLYALYYQSKNDEVSRLADEDPEIGVSLKIMKKIGDISWKNYQCYDVSRKDAIKAANSLCPNRLWSNNLYHALVKTNLVMEYQLKGDIKTTFQYDSMGDYLRAQCILLAYKDDVKLLNKVVKMAGIMNDSHTGQYERIHINHTIKTLLAVWNPKEEIWQRDEFKNGTLTQLLLESLELRNMKSKWSTLPEEMVSDIVLSKDDFINPKYLLDNFTLYRDYLIEPVHDKLMVLGMRERDEKWTLRVNEMQDDYSYFFRLRQMELESNEENARAYISILFWMTSTSHPQLRNYARRIAQGWLRDYSKICILLVEKFYKCDDPYVLRSVYSAIYGVLLVKRDKQLTHDVAETIYKLLYEGQVYVPTEIEVRSWTLKILEFNHLLNPDDVYWDRSTPPYNRTDNLMAIPDGENFDDDAYFGDGNGAKKLHHSLFDWDFNRYIIGTNSNNKSRTYIKDGTPILLSDITNAIAYRIKHVYGYSQKLSEYDSDVKWEDRVHRQSERIGKKYQWIAFGEVRAYLSDTCQMKKNWWDNKPPVEVPYPWHDSRSVTFEPTLTLNGNRSYLDQKLFQELEGENLMDGKAQDWLESKIRVPKPIIIVKDKEYNEWINIVGYQKKEQADGDDKRESFVFICPCMVKKENADSFEQWAKNQCFYGRWMPEDTGHYEYFWNEFPWSDSYKSLDFEVEEDIFGHSAPCKVMLPYAAQLQEYYEGINDEEEFEGMIYMPCADMFINLGLHTAERGVVLNEDGQIVALFRHLQDDILETLVMRRDQLNQYLEAKGYVLFYCMLAEKRLTLEQKNFSMQRLSSCYKYSLNGDPQVVQPMTDEEDFPKSEPVMTDDDYEGISPELWLRIEKEGGRELLQDLLKDYDTMKEKRGEKDENGEKNEQ